MLGKKSSIKPLVEQLQSQGIKVTTTTFVQGKTHRWAIAWTFHKSIEFPVL
jgi:thymidylate kinase